MLRGGHLVSFRRCPPLRLQRKPHATGDGRLDIVQPPGLLEVLGLGAVLHPVVDDDIGHVLRRKRQPIVRIVHPVRHRRDQRSIIA